MNWRAAIILCLAALPALAQTVPANMNPQGIFQGINPRNAAWGGKADATSGVLTAPVVVGEIFLPVYTVSHLPVCGPSLKDSMAAVSDATAPTYGGTLTGGGIVHVPVYCDGASWASR